MHAQILTQMQIIRIWKIGIRLCLSLQFQSNPEGHPFETSLRLADAPCLGFSLSPRADGTGFCAGARL